MPARSQRKKAGTRRGPRPEAILAIDQGTTGTKAILIDRRLRILAEGLAEFPQIYPRPGWVEHDPEEIWTSVRRAVRSVFRSTGLKPTDIEAIGITNQRETAVVWDRRSGEPAHNAIVWQDRRTARECERMRKDGVEREVRRVTGLLLDPYFSGTKIAWILKHVPGARRRARGGDLCFGTVDSYLLHRLTGGDVHATDISNASRTLLLNLRRCRWDDGMLDLLGVPRAMLPEVRSNDAVFGRTRGVGFLPDGIPIAGLIGDQQSALFGQACYRRGAAKCTYGTGSFLLINTGEKPVASRAGVLTTAAWQLRGKTTYALEGSAFVAGAIVQWLRDGLGLIKKSEEVEQLAASVPDSGEVVVVPALTGLGAPYWRPDARGLIGGITRGTTAAHVARAALEGIAFQNHDLLRAMEKDFGQKIRAMKVDGGAAMNDLLMQFQSDLMRVEIIRPRITSTTALGAGLLAGLASGLFPDLRSIESSWVEERRFGPSMSTREVKAHLQRWNAAVGKA